MHRVEVILGVNFSNDEDLDKFLAELIDNYVVEEFIDLHELRRHPRNADNLTFGGFSRVFNLRMPNMNRSHYFVHLRKFILTTTP